jgi:thioredoxin
MKGASYDAIKKILYNCASIICILFLFFPFLLVNFRASMSIKKQFSSFQELIANANTPVLVSFYATWCGYCKALAPILDQVKAQMGDRIQVVKIDSEKYPQLASQYQVQALPTTLLFVDGELASRIKGVMQAPNLMEHLTKFL